MSSQNTVPLLRRILKASLTNQIARYAPALYVRLTGQTGRGAEEESIDDVGNYFQDCINDYFEKLGVGQAQRAEFLRDKRILEYGPGDIPGVALLMIAHGADRVACVDRFPLASLTNEIDLVISRAVLEHVNDLPATFRDMYAALKPGGIALHLVDLKSHGLHRDNPLDFLSWPAWLWSLMYSAKGVPNRLRINTYREVVAQSGLEVISLVPTVHALLTDIRTVRPSLARPFLDLPDEDLSWLGFWRVCRKPLTQ